MPLHFAVTCDIDSTLADTTHRQRMIDPQHREATDWTAYAQACGDDRPTHVVELLARLSANHYVVLVTSRPEAARPQTLAWLAKHRILFDALIMDDGTHASPTAFKVAAVAQVNAERPVSVHIDDWWEVGQAVWDELRIPAVTVRVYAPDRAMTR